MGYVDENLLQGEEIVHRATLHPVIFLKPALFCLTGLLFFAGRAAFGLRPLSYIGALFLLVGFLTALPRYIRRVTSEFAVTNKRVVIKVGFLRRHTLELLLAKVEGIGVEQSIPGRLFNYGTIIVTGTGGTKEPFPSIAKPLEFRRQVQIRAVP